MQAPPRWLAEPELPQLSAHPNATRWLQERGSLTERLRHQWGDVAVHLLDEGLARPLPHESARLQRAPATPAWVRCVLLVCQNQPRVYARTVIPDWTASNPWAEVQRLGRQPLGELLFRLPDLQRSGFEWGQGFTWPHAEQWTGHASAQTRPEPEPEPLARRCVFVREQAPLLLTEVFLDRPGSNPTATSHHPPPSRRTMNHPLHYLIFDASDDGVDTGSWEAMASVRAADLPAVLAEVQQVLTVAARHSPGPRGALDEGGAWDAEQQVQTDGDWTTVTLTLTGPWAWGEALVAHFAE